MSIYTRLLWVCTRTATLLANFVKKINDNSMGLVCSLGYRGECVGSVASLLKGVMVDTKSYYNTPLSQFVCDLVLCWCVLHTPDLTSTDVTGYSYTLDFTTRRGHNMWSLTFPGTWVSPSIRVALSEIFIVGFVMFMEYWFNNSGWLFPSLYSIYCE